MKVRKPVKQDKQDRCHDSISQMTFQQAMDYVASLEPRGWRLGLDRMDAFIQALGLDNAVKNESRKYVHIAGTNGKGSTTHFVQNLILESGCSCGSFMSPYVYNPRERITFDGEMISEPEFANIAARIIPIAEKMSETRFGGITEFEFKAAMGFQFWEDNSAEFVALETGLGGRLDATNVVIPQVSIIVSISPDHQSILGYTEQEIAWEKAGIIKPGKPILAGEMSEQAFQSIEKRAKEQASPLYRFGKEVILENGVLTTPFGEIKNFPEPKMAGEIQYKNFALSTAALMAIGFQFERDMLLKVANETMVPGRFERRVVAGVEIVLDGAHNLASSQNLAQTFREIFGLDRRAILLTNMVHGHLPAEFYDSLAPFASEAIVLPIDFHRAQSVSEMAEVIRSVGIQAKTFEALEEGVEMALSKAQSDGNVILVTGSFYLVGEVGNYLSRTYDEQLA